MPIVESDVFIYPLTTYNGLFHF